MGGGGSETKLSIFVLSLFLYIGFEIEAERSKIRRAAWFVAAFSDGFE